MGKTIDKNTLQWVAIVVIGGSALLFTGSKLVESVSNHGKAMVEFGLHIEEKRNKTNHRFEEIEQDLKRIDRDIADTRKDVGIEWPLDKPADFSPR